MGVLNAQNLSSLSNSFSKGETPGPRIPPGRALLSPQIKGSGCFLSIKIVFFEISFRVRAIFIDKNNVFFWSRAIFIDENCDFLRFRNPYLGLAEPYLGLAEPFLGLWRSKLNP